MLETSPLPCAQSDEPEALPFALAYPQWLVFAAVLGCASRISSQITFDNRKTFKKQLHSCWRPPSGETPFFEKVREQTASPEFWKQLQSNGCAKVVANLLQLSYDATREDISEAEFAITLHALKGTLSGVPSIKRKGISQASPSWSNSERQIRVADLTSSPAEREALAAQRAHAAQDKQARQAEQKLKDRAAAELRAQQKQEAEQREQDKKLVLQAQWKEWFQSKGVSSLQFPTAVYDELHDPLTMLRFKDAYDSLPSPTALRQVLKLEVLVYDSLVTHRAALEERRRQLNEARQAWTHSLVASPDVPSALGLPKVEFEQWRAAGRLPVAATKDFRKWGQTNTVELFDIPALKILVAQNVQAWRDEDLKHMTPMARSARLRAAAKAQTRATSDEIVASIATLHDCVARHEEGAQTLHWTKTVELALAIPVNQEVQQWNARVALDALVQFPGTPEGLAALPAKVGLHFSPEAVDAARVQVEGEIIDLLDSYRTSLTDEQLKPLCKGLQGCLTTTISQQDLKEGKRFYARLSGPVRRLLDEIEASRAQALLQLKDYPQSFPVARSLNRRIHFKLGPTNSGKTYEALQALKTAESGIYLAPLRLLAMELRDRLVAEGVPCNLLTGEEHDMMEGARHTACTVEMMNAQAIVDVAVIDEIQMLQDDCRGWAWTAALVGAPAKDVYVCGADTSHEPCVKLFTALGEVFDVTRLQRKTPLELEQLGTGQPKQSRSRGATETKSKRFALQKGDAVIAFSRKDVLTLSARYRQAGFSVSTIYGALAPEVRRTEAARFNSGEADVVVATDAIGMGLNLPIRRVIFSSVHKFDGVAIRPLNSTEVHQIAGRAGRFGQYPKGFVTTLDPEELEHIRNMLDKPIPVSKAKLPIAPHFWHVEALSEFLNTQHIGAILSFFSTRVAADSPLFDTAALNETTALGHAVDHSSHGTDVSLKDRFTFACAPISHDKPNELDYFKTCFAAFLAGKTLPLPAAPEWLEGSNPNHLEEAEFLSKDVSLYAWLSFKYPQTFCEYEQLPALRSAVSRFVERALLRQGGFGQTSKESFQERSFGR